MRICCIEKIYLLQIGFLFWIPIKPQTESNANHTTAKMEAWIHWRNKKKACQANKSDGDTECVAFTATVTTTHIFWNQTKTKWVVSFTALTIITNIPDILFNICSIGVCILVKSHTISIWPLYFIASIEVVEATAFRPSKAASLKYDLQLW